MSNRQVIEIQFREKFGFQVVIWISLVLYDGERKQTSWEELLLIGEED